jgi:hypothetical protein
MSFTFYLGAHHPHWLAMADFPLFVSHTQLRDRKSLPRAAHRWALDSGGFMQLKLHGGWNEPASSYAAAVRRYQDEIGSMDFAAPQDWMCEPWILERTGLSVPEHQERTVANYLELRMLATDLPFIPVLQGWSPDDYLRHADMYASAGIDLAAEPRVGLGSVCRRQGTGAADVISQSLAPIRLHGFGFKTTGLLRYGQRRFASADSMAWSYNARRSPRLPGCTAHKNCANCFVYAARWRQRLLNSLAAANVRGWQGTLFDARDEAA